MRRVAVMCAATVVVASGALVSACAAPGGSTSGPRTTAAAGTPSPTTSTPAPTTSVPVPATAPPAPAPGLPAADSHVVYSTRSNNTGTHQIERMRVDGTQKVRLTADPLHEHSWARPSPDGRRILFYKALPGNSVNDIDTNSLWVMDWDGSNARELIPDGSYGWTRQGHVEWSPDGTRLLMAAGAFDLQLWTTDTDGRNPALVRNGAGQPISAIDPSWGPGGRSILWAGCARSKILCFWWDQEVFRLDLATGQERQLTQDTFADFDPYVSPDGSTVVWLRCTGTFPIGPWGIMRMSTDGSTPPTPLLDDGNVNSNVDFSRDGTNVVFSRHQLGVTMWQSAARLNMDGSGLGFLGGAPATDGQVSVAYWP